MTINKILKMIFFIILLLIFTAEGFTQETSNQPKTVEIRSKIRIQTQIQNSDKNWDKQFLKVLNHQKRQNQPPNAPNIIMATPSVQSPNQINGPGMPVMPPNFYQPNMNPQILMKQNMISPNKGYQLAPPPVYEAIPMMNVQRTKKGGMIQRYKQPVVSPNVQPFTPSGVLRPNGQVHVIQGGQIQQQLIDQKMRIMHEQMLKKKMNNGKKIKK